MISESELAFERASQEDTLLDTCVLRRWDDAARDAYNHPLPAWAEDGPTPCAFSWQLGRSAYELMGTTQVPGAEARLRLPLDTDIAHVDRVKLTRIAGQALATSLVFEVVGTARRTATCIIASLKTLSE